MLKINFLDRYVSNFKIFRYWVYLLFLGITFVFIINLFLQFFSIILSTTQVAIVSTFTTIILLILELLDFGVKEIIFLIHDKLFLIKEYYIILFAIFFFYLAYKCGNWIENNTNIDSACLTNPQPYDEGK